MEIRVQRSNLEYICSSEVLMCKKPGTISHIQQGAIFTFFFGATLAPPTKTYGVVSK